MQQIHVKCTLTEKKYIPYVGMIKINYADITYVSGENLKTNEHNKEIVCKQSVWMAGYHTHYPSSLFLLLNYKWIEVQIDFTGVGIWLSLVTITV